MSILSFSILSTTRSRVTILITSFPQLLPLSWFQVGTLKMTIPLFLVELLQTKTAQLTPGILKILTWIDWSNKNKNILPSTLFTFVSCSTDWELVKVGAWNQCGKSTASPHLLSYYFGYKDYNFDICVFFLISCKGSSVVDHFTRYFPCSIPQYFFSL